MFINYLKTAIRHLWRHKLFAVINIVGLAVGFAVFNLIVTFIRFELSFDEFHQHHERIYRVEQIRVHEGRQERDAGLPPPLAGALKSEFPEIEAVTQVLKAGELTLSVGDHRRISAAQCLYADASFFEVFSFALTAGDRRTALDEPYSAVISERIARALFGDDNPMGQTIRVNHRFDFKVTGIHRKVPANSHLQFDLLISLGTYFSRLNPETLSSWGDNWLPLYILLKKKHRGEDLNQKLRQALWTYPDLGIYDRQVYLRPLKDIHLHSHVLNELGINSDIRNVCIFGSVAVLILLIACINYMNLATAGYSDRAKEVGVRKVMGASRSTLAVQFWGESVLSAFLAMFLAVILSELMLPQFNALVNRNLEFSYLKHWADFLGLIGIALAAGVLSGVYPAMYLSAFRPVDVLKARTSTGREGILARKSLVLVQFFFAIVLIIGTITVLRQVDFLLHKDLGYNTNHLLVIQVKDTTAGKNAVFRNRILQNPRVLKAGISDYLPYDSSNWTLISWEGATDYRKEHIKVHVNYVDEHLLSTYGMHIVKGRKFFEMPSAGREHLVLLNESASRQIGWEEPVGKRIYYSKDYRSRSRKPLACEVVGVVADYNFLSLHNPITPLMLRLYEKDMTGGNISVRIGPDQVAETIEFLKVEFQRIFPIEEFNCRFLDEDFQRMYHEERRAGRVIYHLAVLAILIACLGLFGLAGLSIKQRTKEIGVRKALGASEFSIATRLMAEYAKLVLFANILAWPVAYVVMQRWLDDFPYRIQLQPFTFLLAALLVCLIALATVFYQAVRAARADPVEALRYE